MALWCSKTRFVGSSSTCTRRGTEDRLVPRRRTLHYALFWRTTRTLSTRLACVHARQTWFPRRRSRWIHLQSHQTGTSWTEDHGGNGRAMVGLASSEERRGQAKHREMSLTLRNRLTRLSRFHSVVMVGDLMTIQRYPTRAATDVWL